MIMNYTFKGNFGTLELVVDDNGTASGSYQEGGILSSSTWYVRKRFWTVNL